MVIVEFISNRTVDFRNASEFIVFFSSFYKSPIYLMNESKDKSRRILLSSSIGLLTTDIECGDKLSILYNEKEYNVNDIEKIKDWFTKS